MSDQIVSNNAPETLTPREREIAYQGFIEGIGHRDGYYQARIEKLEHRNTLLGVGLVGSIAFANRDAIKTLAVVGYKKTQDKIQSIKEKKNERN